MAYESAAYDNRDLMNPTFYITVDETEGPLVKFTPPTGAAKWAVENNDYSDLLHSTAAGVKYEYFKVISFDETTGDGTYEWTDNLEEGRASAVLYHTKGEGIDIREGKLYYTTKVYKHLFIIDLDNFTFNRSST